MNIGQRLGAECLGTFCLVFCGCSSAVLAGGLIGLVGIGLAFGLTVMAMAYALGHISGCHLNPAVTIGFVVGGRFKIVEVIPYIIAQTVGAVAGAGLLYVIATGKAGFTIDHEAAGAFASNGYEHRSPGGYSLMAGLISEIALTFIFMIIILGSTHGRASTGMAPIAIGLGLTMLHYAGGPITNLSLNPARSTGPALFVGSPAIMQLWLFWLAPIVGAVLAGLTYQCLAPNDK